MAQGYIVSATRTAIGSFGGSLKGVSAAKLGEVVIREAIKRAGIDAASVDEVILGNVLQAAQGQNPARQAAIHAGIPCEVTATTVNKVCGSGLTAVVAGTRAIRLGDAQCVVAGGMESMSESPFALRSHRWGQKMNHDTLVDLMVNDGLWDVFNDYHMGVTAENVAERFGISRAAQDAFAAGSQQKAAQAINSGRFRDEITPVTVPQGKGDPVTFDRDEFVRPGTTPEILAKLRPAFKKDGTVTAGNASGVNDGAAAVIVAGEEFVERHGLRPLARIVAYGSRGVDPSVMGLGPVPSVRMALERAGLGIAEIDLVEANEAFAAQALAVQQELGFDESRVNVNGGAIALGHPIGASGARILVTLLYEMAKRDVRYGLATLCIGGGMGEAVIVERDARCR